MDFFGYKSSESPKHHSVADEDEEVDRSFVVVESGSHEIATSDSYRHESSDDEDDDDRESQTDIGHDADGGDAGPPAPSSSAFFSSLVSSSILPTNASDGDKALVFGQSEVSDHHADKESDDSEEDDESEEDEDDGSSSDHHASSDEAFPSTPAGRSIERSPSPAARRAPMMPTFNLEDPEQEEEELGAEPAKPQTHTPESGPTWKHMICVIVSCLMYGAIYDCMYFGISEYFKEDVESDLSELLQEDSHIDVMAAWHRRVGQVPLTFLQLPDTKAEEITVDIATKLCQEQSNGALLRTHAFEASKELSKYIPRLAEPVPSAEFSLWKLGTDHYGIVCFAPTPFGRAQHPRHKRLTARRMENENGSFELMTFPQAQELCAKHGQVMAKIRHFEDWLWLMRELSDSTRMDAGYDFWTKGYWIGLTDQEKEGDFTWTTDGSSFTLQDEEDANEEDDDIADFLPNWSPGNPNNYIHPSGADEDCVELLWYDGKLNDLPCSESLLGVVCE